ncbi:apolipoprotein N-acyltransferase [Cnuibacter physcomitrellae]|uniref:Apolipoprotein N-acyltransferase n=1 Tax=Cnuibacter physcomitrellae TaxID=1619308 RepID=A0A1X9LJC7_9MICO|nr:apolipoprotein N-acyltransferase [Cnuibacter physcomitrellae]ARJ05305.1 apolipoprotein N-acyltransferase [Cnuibacter physcomitrellae]GGI35413.1 apolipoprotein N-acyltransferase [Cnuibacter physcomitrellae]
MTTLARDPSVRRRSATLSSPARRPRLDESLDRARFVRPVMPLWLAVLAAAAAGVALDAGFPDKGWWPFTLVGVAVVLLALIGRSWWQALLIGFVAGAVFWGVDIFWLTLYLGPVPWLGLAGFMGLYFAAGSLLIALVYRRADRAWPSRWGRLGVLPLVIAGLWILREGVSAVWPWGGFSWGRVAMSQSESPTSDLVAWVGISGLSFVLVWLVAFLIQVARESPLRPGIRVLTAGIAMAAVLAVPAWPAPTQGTSRIAAVQGNSDAGLFSQHSPGDILSDHVAGSLTLAGQDPDMVVWPENGSDLDPARYPYAAAALDEVSATLGGAPIIAGTIQVRGDKVYNTSLLWQDGRVQDFYDKRHPVPFAEWMPARDFFHALAPDLVDLVTRDYEFGSTDMTFDVNGIIAGISICFDITDDAVMRETTLEGAQVLLSQTNNADFGRTDENLQQLAIARLRAIELGRSVVNISTVGTSAIIAPDGSTIEEIPAFQPGTMLADVPLATTLTPASVVGGQLEWLGAGFGLLGLAVALTARPLRPRRP